MKRNLWILGLLLALACAGCGAAEEISPESVPPAEEAESPAVPETAPETEDHVLLVLETAVDGGQLLRLEAIGKQKDGSDECGVREIQVYDGSNLIQTFSVQEAIDAGGISGSLGAGYTDCWEPELAMKTVDMNFDGISDIGLFGWIPAGANIPYYYWLWDSGSRQFQYAFCLPNAVADPETEQIVCDLTQSNGYTTEYYQYDAQGALQLVYSVSETYSPSGALEREVYRLIDGQLVREE